MSRGKLRNEEKLLLKLSDLGLQAEKRLVPLPEQPGNRRDPKPDDRGVGREDLTVVLWSISSRNYRNVLLMRQARVFEAVLCGVMKNDCSDRVELATINLFTGLCSVRRSPSGLYE